MWEKTLNPNIKIIREKIPLNKIVILDEGVEADLKNWENLLKTNVNLGEYPWSKLIDLIKEGWDPAFSSKSIIQRGQFSPFRVLKKVFNGDILYIPENGKHRLVVLRYLNIDPVECFVLDGEGLNSVSKERLESFLVHMNEVVGGGQQYQSLLLPNGIEHQGRDITSDVFNSSGWNDFFWCGKTVLDIGCHIGGICFEAKRRGAKRVVGFDLDGKLIGLGKELSKLLGLEVEFFHCDFWDFPLWEEKFDIVMAHQCLSLILKPRAVLADNKSCFLKYILQP